MELNPTIQAFTQGLIELIAPNKILLFSQKHSMDGTLQSFKLCVVAATDDRRALLQKIYRELDCPVPFDLVLYTPAEWDHLSQRQDSFACRTAASGRVIYE